MPVSEVKIASSAACRSIAAASASGRIRVSGLSSLRAQLVHVPAVPRSRGRRACAGRSRQARSAPVASSRWSRSGLALRRSREQRRAASPASPTSRRRPGRGGRCARRARRPGRRPCPPGTSPVGEVGAEHQQHVAARRTRGAAAGLPIRPVWPTWNGLSRSRPSLALRVSTIGAASRSASASTSSRASRAPCPTSSVTGRRRRSRSAAARAAPRRRVRTCAGGGDEARLARVLRAGRAPPTSPGSVSTATPRSLQRGADRLLEQHGHLVGAGDRVRGRPRRRRTARRCRPPGRSRCRCSAQRHLPADRQHRGVRLLGVVEAVEQVDRARADGAHAHAEPAGQLRLGAGGERARLLVAHADPLDAVLAADRVGDRVQGVADDAPDLGTPWSASAATMSSATVMLLMDVRR